MDTHILLVLVAGMLLALTACGDGTPTPAAREQMTEVNGTQIPVTKTCAAPILGSSVFVPGPDRFVFGLIDAATGAPVEDVPQVDAHFYKLSETGDTATKIDDAQAIYRGEGCRPGSS